jgi:hypothetical protein
MPSIKRYNPIYTAFTENSKNISVKKNMNICRLYLMFFTYGCILLCSATVSALTINNTGPLAKGSGLIGGATVSTLTINTVPLAKGSGLSVGTDNHPGSSQYLQTIGQTFMVEAPNTILNSFSFQIQDGPISRGSGSDDSFTINIYVMEWENQHAKLPVLYQNQITLHLNAFLNLSYQTLSFTPNLSLQTGKQYVVFLSLIGISNSNWRVITIGGNLENSAYTGGCQVYRGSEITTIDGLTKYPWGGTFSNNTQYDLAFTIQLNQANTGQIVPGPVQKINPEIQNKNQPYPVR